MMLDGARPEPIWALLHASGVRTGIALLAGWANPADIGEGEDDTQRDRGLILAPFAVIFHGAVLADVLERITARLSQMAARAEVTGEQENSRVEDGGSEPNRNRNAKAT